MLKKIKPWQIALIGAVFGILMIFLGRMIEGSI